MLFLVKLNAYIVIIKSMQIDINMCHYIKTTMDYIEMIDSSVNGLKELFEKYKENEYMVQRIYNHINTILPNTLDTEYEHYNERLIRTNTLHADQETFIKVIHTLQAGKYNEEGKFLPWVIRIAHNLVIDYFRKQKRNPVITNVEGFDIFDVIQFYDEPLENMIIREQSHQDLKRMIQLLPTEQKEVLIMRHYGDLSFKEIADITGVSINTALGRMRYALNNLRKMMVSPVLVNK